MEKATFGAGCFWGVEVAFANIPGVTATAVGYEGGKKDAPTYRDVCTDTTGHAEVVELDFDPAKVGFEALLDAFFSLHDPTQLNRQGPDWGTQYRSAVFYHSPEQKAAAEAKIAELSAIDTALAETAETAEPEDDEFAHIFGPIGRAGACDDDDDSAGGDADQESAE